jgi:chorismate mutase/prephenate dehydratase
MKPEELKKYRDQIDDIDDQLIELLVKRAGFVKHVGERKKVSNLPVFRPEREVAIIERMCKKNKNLAGFLAENSVATIWLEIISGCRALERQIEISYLGPPGTYSELAARTLFGHQVLLHPYDSLEEVVRVAEIGKTDIALIPVENSTEGTVGRSLDLLLKTSLPISAELSIPIRHLLLRKIDGFDSVQKIVAHEQSLSQCQNWLDENLPNVPRVALESNGQAAKEASKDPSMVAIAGHLAAKKYDLKKIADRIENDSSNRTRFAALGNFVPDSCGVDQTSLILSVPDKAGAMLSLIKPLAQHGVSMKRFESRPYRKSSQLSWEYYFYLDIDGHESDPSVSEALKEIKDRAGFFKNLGSYPRFEKLGLPSDWPK